MKVIELKNVWEKYRLKFIREGRVFWEDIWALQDINFSLEKGQVLGIIGQNGAGKTTLLKIIAGMFAPDKGEVHVRGKVSTLMELGAGFNPEFTGRQNLIFNSRMYGLDDKALSRQLDKVIAFADLGKFIDAPVKFYSQGMYARLAFALAIFVEPDILLIDDILAVGDEEARQKCIDKVFELKQAGKTIIVVSHDLSMVSKLCSRSVILENGRIIQEDSSDKVIAYYLETVGLKSGIAVLKKEKAKVVFNNGRMAINYNGYPVTKGLGVYASFFMAYLNEWFSPNSLSWKISSSSTDEVVIEGSAVDGSPSQLWKIKLGDEVLNLRIELPEKGEKLHLDFILNPVFERWMTLDKEGVFPVYAYKTKWQDLALEGCPEGVIALAPDVQDSGLPNLVLQGEDGNSQLKLFNAGYEQEARIVQPYSNTNSFIAVNIRMFPGKNEFEQYIDDLKGEFIVKQKQQLLLAEQAEQKKLEEEKRRMLLAQQAEQEKLKAACTISSADTRVFVDLENKKVSLFYRDKEITKGNGLHSCFLLNGSWYDTSSAEWQVTRQGEGLSIRFSWPELDLAGIWKIAFKDKELMWNLRIINNNAQFSLEAIKFGLFVNKEYQKFFCGYQEGVFPAGFGQWQDLPLEKPGARLFGLRKVKELPALILDNREGLNCVVQNSDAKTGSRVIQLDFSKAGSLPDSREYSFTTELDISDSDNLINDHVAEEKRRMLLAQQAEQKKLEEEKRRMLLAEQAEQEKLKAACTISSADTRVFVDLENKKVSLFYRDKEITKG
ncbi:MAG: ABC transporter ATP-binding protein, partial [Candidatus Omnitrophica bacterium]|nr:ABC transporter ATP-binding protein [Candidatus Omnitrophota bacterium]